MTILFSLVVLVLASWALRRIWPAKGLKWGDSEKLNYEACHVSEGGFLK